MAAYSIKLDLSAITGLAQAAKVAPVKFNQAVTDLLTEIVALWAHLAVKATPRDRGFLAGSYVHGVEDTGNLMTAFVGVSGLGAKYVWPTELGSKPHWPPPQELEEWATRKGITMVDAKGKQLSMDRVGFLISRAISRKGTIKRFDYHGAAMFEKAQEQGDADVSLITERHLSKFLEQVF